MRRERNHSHVYEYGLRKMGTALVNGSHLNLRQDRSIDDVVCLMARATKMRNDWPWSGKSPHFTLSFSFQINFLGLD